MFLQKKKHVYLNDLIQGHLSKCVWVFFFFVKLIVQYVYLITLHLFVYRGRISYFTHPPETHILPTHISAQILTAMSKEFDWGVLEKGNQETLAGKESVNHKKQQFVLQQFCHSGFSCLLINVLISCILECNPGNVEMAFCMTTSGMTEMGHEEPAEIESLDVDFQHASESLDGDDDPEVHHFYIITTSACLKA